MVKIEYDRRFRKNFKARILPRKNLFQRYQQRLEIFIKDPHDLALRDHKLIGSLKNTRAFSITGDIRVIYLVIKQNHFIFLDIGTHNQVYS